LSPLSGRLPIRSPDKSQEPDIWVPQKKELMHEDIFSSNSFIKTLRHNKTLELAESLANVYF